MALNDNNFVGQIPVELGNPATLIAVALSNNFLTGPIPALWPPGLFLLNLEVNSLTGTIPTELGMLQFLASFSVFSNSLTGRVPDELCGNPGLVVVVDCTVECNCCPFCF